MMPEYIDRDALIKRICEEKCRSEYGKCQKGRNGNKVILCVCDFIRMQKAADVSPVVHAQWVEYEVFPLAPSMNGYPCGNCGMHFSASSVPTLKYCPNCGAKMDGGNNETD